MNRSQISRVSSARQSQNQRRSSKELRQIVRSWQLLHSSRWSWTSEIYRSSSLETWTKNNRKCRCKFSATIMTKLLLLPKSCRRLAKWNLRTHFNLRKSHSKKAPIWIRLFHKINKNNFGSSSSSNNFRCINRCKCKCSRTWETIKTRFRSASATDSLSLQAWTAPASLRSARVTLRAGFRNRPTRQIILATQSSRSHLCSTTTLSQPKEARATRCREEATSTRAFTARSVAAPWAAAARAVIAWACRACRAQAWATQLNTIEKAFSSKANQTGRKVSQNSTRFIRAFLRRKSEESSFSKTLWPCLRNKQVVGSYSGRWTKRYKRGILSSVRSFSQLWSSTSQLWWLINLQTTFAKSWLNLLSRVSLRRFWLSSQMTLWQSKWTSMGPDRCRNCLIRFILWLETRVNFSVPW